MNNVYLVDYCRSAFTQAHPVKREVDAFADIRGDRLLAQLIDHTLANSNLNPEHVDELTVGCALQVKEQFSFGGRYPLYLSSLGDQCASRALDQQCGSGLAALRMSALNIASGAADIALAGGYEHMTRVPMGPTLFKEGVLTTPKIPADRYDMTVAMNMGLTAEALARKGDISREAMDKFAAASHHKAADAAQAGYFQGEIVPLADGEGKLVSEDRCIRPGTNVERLLELRPAFQEDGLISAGNSSPLTTGAALGVLMSEAAMVRSDMKPIARIVCCVDRGTQPELMGQGVVPAVEAALKLSGHSVEDIGCWEINEAFSVVPLYAMQKLNIPRERVNINGGALALGHPLGATGIRLAGTLARLLQQRGDRYGCATACIGGGQGIAMIIERV